MQQKNEELSDKSSVSPISEEDDMREGGIMSTAGSSNRTSLLFAALVLQIPGVVGAPSLAVAQSSIGALEEIIVSARRREESLQEVPTAISAFSGEELRDRNIETLANLNAVAPNFSVMGGGLTGESTATFRARGIPGVAVYIDGAYQSTNDGLFAMDVVGVQRIEVLRGPQGTLFGQTARAGAVNYVTQLPGDEFNMQMAATIGEYSRRDMNAAVDIPITETLKTRFTLANENRKGFMNNVVIDRNQGDVNDQVFRADIFWEPSDAFTLRLASESVSMDRIGPARVVLEITEPQYVAATDFNSNPFTQAYWNLGVLYNTHNNVSGAPGGVLGKYDTKVAWESLGLKVEQDRTTLDLNWDINDALRLRSIVSSIDSIREAQLDLDGAAEVQILEVDSRTKHEGDTQEIQLLGTHGRVDWVVGAYYWEEENRSRRWQWALPEMTCDLPSPLSGSPTTVEQRASCAALRARAIAGGNGVSEATFLQAANGGFDSSPWNIVDGKAYFADVTMRITDKLTASLGYRTSDEDSSNARANPVIRAPRFPDTDPAGDVYAFAGTLAPPGLATFGGETSRVSLQYQWSDAIMTYVSFADGFGPGGQSNLNPNQFGCHPDIPVGPRTFPSENLKNYEIGLRADWLDERLRTNVTAFTLDWKNIQTTQYVASAYADLPQPCTLSGPQAQQIDRNLDGQPDILAYAFGFTTTAAAAKVRGVEFEGVWSPTSSLRLSLNVGLLDTEYTDPGAAAIGALPAVTAGAPFPQAPEMTASLGLQYSLQLASGGTLTPRVDYTFTDDYVLSNNLPNQRTQEAFGLMNARLTYDSGEAWSLSLFGTNLTNEYYQNSGFYSLAEQIHFVTIGRPREIGATLTYAFR